MRLAIAIALVPVLLASCIGRRGPPTPAGYPEATSLLGAPLYAVERTLSRRQTLEADLAAAYAAYERNPDDADAIIWVGRRVAYLGRYRDAIGIFSEGIRKHPGDPRMYRHRGHRWITVREFDRAVQDLQHAARLLQNRPDPVEPDGNPNQANVPRTTLHFNVWYHLGVAHYLRGELNQALYAFRAALAVSQNDDTRVAATDWAYMTLRRLDRDAEAAALLEPIQPAGMEILENGSYHRRLLLYKGLLPPDSLLAQTGEAAEVATLQYGVGNWHLYNGRPDEAEEIFWRVTSAEDWAPFGYIAAEADLRRMLRRRRN